jgi:hypothetical protein
MTCEGLDYERAPILALAVRWALDQAPTIALGGARRPEFMAPPPRQQS